jgi:hypothetical protein
MITTGWKTKKYTKIEWLQIYGKALEKTFFYRVGALYSDETEKETREIIAKHFGADDLEGLLYRADKYSDLELGKFIEGSFARTFGITPKKRSWLQGFCKVFTDFKKDWNEVFHAGYQGKNTY